MSADIVSGQIIATVIVVAFVAVFLLREWISQNARPGVFDDAEGPPELQDAELPPHANDAREEAALPPGIAVPDPRAHEAPEIARRNELNRIAVDLRAKAAELEARRAELRAELAAKKTELEAALERKQRRHSWSEAYSLASTSAVAGDSEVPTLDSNPAVPGDDDNVAVPQAPADFKMDFSWTPLDFPNRDFEDSSLQAELPSSMSSAPPTPQTPSRQRPPLFSTVTLPDEDNLSPSPMSSSSRSWTPLASPSLATYRAPEELEAGSSKLSGYFTEHQEEDEESPAGDSGSTEREYDTYFREADDDDDDAAPSKGKGKEPAVQAAPLQARQDSESDHDMPGLAHMTDAESDDGMELGEGRHVEVHIPDPEFNPFDGEDEAADGDDEQLMDIREALAEPRPDFPDPEEGDVGMEDDMEGALEGAFFIFVKTVRCSSAYDSYWVAWSYICCATECELPSTISSALD